MTCIVVKQVTYTRMVVTRLTHDRRAGRAGGRRAACVPSRSRLTTSGRTDWPHYSILCLLRLLLAIIQFTIHILSSIDYSYILDITQQQYVLLYQEAKQEIHLKNGSKNILLFCHQHMTKLNRALGCGIFCFEPN